MKILISDNIRSLHNIGSFFRTADGAGVDMIFLCGQSATPPHKDIAKTALGAEKVTSWEYFSCTLDAITKAKDLYNCTILALEKTDDAKNIFVNTAPKDFALVVGHEIMGVSKDALEVSDQIISIPMFGEKECLNVSVATGVALYQLISRQ